MGPGNKKRKCNQSGYTLIELLLVVAVISLIAALGVKTYRDKSESDRVNIASLNLQHVLESGIAYNTANKGLWPKNNWNPCNSTSLNPPPQDDNFVQNYLPNESNQSNYGVPVCWSGDGDPNNPNQEQRSPRFWAAVNIGNDTNAINLAKRIAARLPNAIITNDPNNETNPANTCDGTNPCFVKAVVAMPANGETSSATYIAGMGYCDGAQPAGGVQAGWNGNVKCIRTTLGEQYPTKAFGSDSKSNTSWDYSGNASMGQYAIYFICKANETPSVYLTPNYLQMERSSTQTSPMYEIKVANNARQDTNGNIIPDCDPLNSAGGAKCVVTLRATFGAISDSGANLITDVGCTDDYAKAGMCICPNDASGKPNCAGSSDKTKVRPGYVGASYIAVCSSESAKKTAVNMVQNFW